MHKRFDLLKELVEKKSITPDDAGCAHNIATFLGLDITDLSIGNTTNSYLSVGKGPLLLFLGHTDVVPPGPAAQWSSDPFKLTLTDTHATGRGVVDMKGAIWAFCHALKSHTPKHIGIGLLLTSDEEGSGENGIKHIAPLLAKNNISPKWILVGEPTSETYTGDTIKTARRGSAHFYLTISGKQGHIAYPQHADNPCHKLTSLLTQVTAINQQLPEQSNLEVFHLQSSTSIENIIPGSITVHLNLRYINPADVSMVQNKLRPLDEKLTVHISASPYNAQGSELKNHLSKVIHGDLGNPPKCSYAGGTSDARWLAPFCDEIVEYGLPNPTAHKIDENCKISDLDKLHTHYLSLIKQLDQAYNPEKNNRHAISIETTGEPVGN